jgi:flagellar protein FliO/FliZ
MSRACSSLILLGLLFVAQTAQAEDAVIYPRGTAPAGGSSGAADGGRSNTVLLLGSAAVAAGAGWWLWQKRRAVTQGAGGSARLAIVESRSLGSRQYLVVADYDGRKFLLGVCPGSIKMLTPLDAGKTPEQS